MDFLRFLARKIGWQFLELHISIVTNSEYIKEFPEILLKDFTFIFKLTKFVKIINLHNVFFYFGTKQNNSSLVVEKWLTRSWKIYWIVADALNCKC